MIRQKINEADEVLTAYLYAVERRSQADIARELNFSPAAVSRLLDHARGTYFIQETRFLEREVPPAVMKEVQTRLHSAKLSVALDKICRLTTNRAGPKVRVFQVADPNTYGSRLSYIEAFAGVAYGYVLQLVARSRVCAVTWGTMLARLAAAANAGGAVLRSETDVIPVAGEPLGFAQTMVSSSIIADELQRLLSGGAKHARSLMMVPALIPRDFSDEERAAIKKLSSRLSHYQEIFGDSENRLASSVDAIVTSVGRAPLGFQAGSLLEEDEREFFVGDIGGVLLPKQLAADEAMLLRQNEVVSDVRGRWTGLRLEDLRGCADRAAGPDAPREAVGVVVVSVGAERAPVIFECVKRGLVSHLAVDSSLNEALLEECQERGARL